MNNTKIIIGYDSTVDRFFLKIHAVSQIKPIVATEPTTPAKLVQPAATSTGS